MPQFETKCDIIQSNNRWSFFVFQLAIPKIENKIENYDPKLVKSGYTLYWSCPSWKKLYRHSKDVKMYSLFSRCAYLTMMNHQFEITRILSEKSWRWYFRFKNFKISVESKSKRAQCLKQWTLNILRFRLKESNAIS